MTDILVATEDLFYCSSNEARLYAIDALLISRAREIRFYDAYYGFVSHHLRDWIEDHVQELEPEQSAHLLTAIRQAEPQRFFLDQKENSVWKILTEEVFPVGCVLHQIFLGSNKDRALREAREILQHRFEKDERLADLPKSVQKLSKRKLERLWAIYSEVPHYVWMTFVNHLRVSGGIEPVGYEQGRENWGQIMSAFDAVSPTKPIGNPEPVFLKFVTMSEFRDQLPEIPPNA
ncbi:hypothetical protein [Tateyamaria sp. SN6-1]|uniref:hypothetical protein n=1 Tax=Tateyamaria sp. SN6-1 TaxID=3092148 RepID=UPI0039F5D281